MLKTGFLVAAALFVAQPCFADPDEGASSNAAGTAAAPPSTDQSAPSATPSASSSETASAPSAAASQAAPARAGFEGIALPPPPDGKGQVIFFRKPAFQGAAVWFKVRENGVELGKITSGVYFIAVADPGEHTYTAATENKDSLKLQVDAGETYFVEGTVTMGFFIGEANLAPSDEASFDKISRKLKLASAPPREAPSAKP
jgi:hypothetical protein